MKLLVTGGGGQLGRALTRLAVAAGYELRAPTRAELDITDDTALRDACTWAEVVINAAAYTDVNRAESERDAAFAANATAPGRLAEHCAAKGDDHQCDHAKHADKPCDRHGEKGPASDEPAQAPATAES